MQEKKTGTRRVSKSEKIEWNYGIKYAKVLPRR